MPSGGPDRTDQALQRACSKSILVANVYINELSSRFWSKKESYKVVLHLRKSITFKKNLEESSFMYTFAFKMDFEKALWRAF